MILLSLNHLGHDKVRHGVHGRNVDVHKFLGQLPAALHLQERHGELEAHADVVNQDADLQVLYLLGDPGHVVVLAGVGEVDVDDLGLDLELLLDLGSDVLKFEGGSADQHNVEALRSQSKGVSFTDPVR